MAHDGLPGGPPDSPPGDSGVDPTQYANYGGTGSAAYGEPAAYSESDDQQFLDQYASPQPRRAWHQRPAALVGLGMLTAAMLALLIYAIVDFRTAEKPRQTVTTVTSTAPTQAPTTESPTTESPTTTPTPTTITVLPPRPSTTVTVSPPVTTITETTIERRFPRLPDRLNPPPLYQPPPG